MVVLTEELLFDASKPSYLLRPHCRFFNYARDDYTTHGIEYALSVLVLKGQD